MSMEEKQARFLSRYPCSKPTMKPNSLMIPVSQFDTDDIGARDFNKVFEIAKSISNRIIRTPSGGISYSTRGEASDWRRLSHCVEITILSGYGFWRFQFRSKTANKGKMAGRSAFSRFRKMLKEDGIDLADYEIENGKEIKEQIEKPMISFAFQGYAGITFEKAHHIDFHSSYPAGLANTHPEFRKTLKRIYDKRKEGEIYKAILVYSIGFMQSIALCGAKWAHLSKDAIADNNARVRDMCSRLKKSGRFPILFNTDGIWYAGEIYHGEGEGQDMGQWSNDHTDCRFRAASQGAYEFVEKGRYRAVVRGIPEGKKRKWKWGSIFGEESIPVRYAFNDNDGIIKITEE